MEENEDFTEVFYYCDPEKATECKKTICYLNGGKCNLTTRPEWGKRKVKNDFTGRKQAKK